MNLATIRQNAGIVPNKVYSVAIVEQLRTEYSCYETTKVYYAGILLGTIARTFVDGTLREERVK